MLVELSACWFSANVTWVKFGPRYDYIEAGKGGVTAIVWVVDAGAVLVYRENAKEVDVVPWAGVAHAKAQGDLLDVLAPKKVKK